jgi:hypothetical protein
MYCPYASTATAQIRRGVALVLSEVADRPTRYGSVSGIDCSIAKRRPPRTTMYERPSESGE